MLTDAAGKTIQAHRVRSLAPLTSLSIKVEVEKTNP